MKKAAKPKTPRRTPRHQKEEEPLRHLAEEAAAPTVPDEEPVGAPHLDEEPGGVPDDLHARWSAWEAEHQRKTTHLTAVVAAAMIGIALVWFLRIADGVRSFARAPGAADRVRESFLERLSAAGRELDAFVSTNRATSAPPERSAADADARFLEELRAKAEEAATAQNEAPAR